LTTCCGTIGSDYRQIHQRIHRKAGISIDKKTNFRYLIIQLLSGAGAGAGVGVGIFVSASVYVTGGFGVGV
jgi:hypothetical protein